MLTVITHNVAEIVVLRCRGRLVRGEESALLCSAVQHHGREIVLDLGGVTAIDAGGIGALVALQAAGVYLKLMNPTEPVRHVLQLTGLEKVFEICPRWLPYDVATQGVTSCDKPVVARLSEYP
jgi:anti-anti-sigma factor